MKNLSMDMITGMSTFFVENKNITTFVMDGRRKWR